MFTQVRFSMVFGTPKGCTDTKSSSAAAAKHTNELALGGAAVCVELDELGQERAVMRYVQGCTNSLGGKQSFVMTRSCPIRTPPATLAWPTTDLLVFEGVSNCNSGSRLRCCVRTQESC